MLSMIALSFCSAVAAIRALWLRHSFALASVAGVAVDVLGASTSAAAACLRRTGSLSTRRCRAAPGVSRGSHADLRRQQPRMTDAQFVCEKSHLLRQKTRNRLGIASTADMPVPVYPAQLRSAASSSKSAAPSALVNEHTRLSISSCQQIEPAAPDSSAMPLAPSLSCTHSHQTRSTNESS